MPTMTEGGSARLLKPASFTSCFSHLTSVLLDFQVFALHSLSFQCGSLTRPLVRSIILHCYFYIARPYLVSFCLFTTFLSWTPNCLVPIRGFHRSAYIPEPRINYLCLLGTFASSDVRTFLLALSIVSSRKTTIDNKSPTYQSSSQS